MSEKSEKMDNIGEIKSSIAKSFKIKTIISNWLNVLKCNVCVLKSEKRASQMVLSSFFNGEISLNRPTAFDTTSKT